MAGYTAPVFSDFGTDFSAFRLGGGRYGELTYPPAVYGDAKNAYSAFDASVKAMSPTPGWVPGQPSPNGEAGEFLDWYLGQLVQYEPWQITTLRQHYSGDQMMLFPSWRIRPGQIDRAVAVNLNGSTSAEINGRFSGASTSPGR